MELYKNLENLNKIKLLSEINTYINSFIDETIEEDIDSEYKSTFAKIKYEMLKSKNKEEIKAEAIETIIKIIDEL